MKEREAWLWIAENIGYARNVGLCYFINQLGIDGDVTTTVFRRMKRRVHSHRGYHGGYIWPLNDSGVRSRVWFCRKQARELQNKRKAKP